MNLLETFEVEAARWGLSAETYALVHGRVHRDWRARPTKLIRRGREESISRFIARRWEVLRQEERQLAADLAAALVEARLGQLPDLGAVSLGELIAGVGEVVEQGDDMAVDGVDGRDVGADRIEGGDLRPAPGENHVAEEGQDALDAGQVVGAGFRLSLRGRFAGVWHGWVPSGEAAQRSAESGGGVQSGEKA
jgi:hypothetical protein